MGSAAWRFGGWPQDKIPMHARDKGTSRGLRQASGSCIEARRRIARRRCPRVATFREGFVYLVARVSL